MDDTNVLVRTLQQAMPYISKFAGKTVVIKLGGSAFSGRDTTLQDVVSLRALGVRPVLVHGGGSDISSLLKRLGIEAQFVGGLRVTDEATIDAVVMVLAGKVNKELVAALNRLGAPAMGMSGIDGCLLRARIKDPQLGLVGAVEEVNLGLLEAVCAAGYVPVIAPLAYGEDGELLNINGDTAAGEIAAALGAAKMVFLTDVDGIHDQEGKTISSLSQAQAQQLISDGIVSGGMIPKVQACLTALKGAAQAHIVNGKVEHALLSEMYTESGVGTMITA